MANQSMDLAATLTEEKDLKFEKALISAVKGFPCIYILDHWAFKEWKHNKFAWNHISFALKKPFLDCQNRWFAIYQTFLYKLKKEDFKNWTHFESLKQLQFCVAPSYSEFIQTKLPVSDFKPTAQQKRILFRELILHRAMLLNPETPLEWIQKFWAATAEELNSAPDAPQRPVICWQKYWWDLKLKLGELRLKLLDHMGGKSKELIISMDYQNFMQFYTVQSDKSKSPFYVPLGRNTEFGCNVETSHKCKKCTSFLTDLEKVYCERCRKAATNVCDLCSVTDAKQHLKVFQVKNWSSIAKNLLPFKYRTFPELLVCLLCSTRLKNKAAVVWKVCRVCGINHQMIENLYSNENELKVFKQATNITFSVNDGLPGYICKICKVQMQQFNNFFLRFSRVQVRLRVYQQTKFIHIDPPGEGEKRSITEIPKMFLMKRKIPAETPPLSTTETAQGGQQPKLQVCTSSQIQMQGKPTILKTAAKLLPTVETPIKRATVTKMQSDPPTTPAISTFPKATMPKRFCIMPSKTKGVVSLHQVSSGCNNPGRISAAPTKGVIILNPESTAGSKTPLIKKGLCTLPAGNAKVPLVSKNTGEMISKRLCATNQIVFTVSEEQNKDQPPVFCIQKPTSVIEISNLAPATGEIIIEPDAIKIKTEKLDEGYQTPPNPNEKPSMQLGNSSNASTLSVESNYCLPTQKTIKETKVPVRLDGSAGFIKLTPNQGFHNEFLSAIFPHKVTKCPPSSNLSVQEEQQRPQTQPPQPQSRLRKYWGPVDEFQITSVSEKINQKTIHQSSVEPVPFIPSASPSIEILPPNKVKEEPEDKNESQTAMFYPDSFELNNLSIDADVSSIINKMITKQEPIDEENSFQYINPSFLLSFVEDQSKEHVFEKTNKSKDQTNTPKEENKLDNPSEERTTFRDKTPKTAIFKNLRIKLKRSGRLKKIASKHANSQKGPIKPSCRKSPRSLQIRK